MNVLHHQLDMEDIEGFRLLLAYTGDPNDSSSLLGSPLICADSHVTTKEGITAYRFALQGGLADIAALLRQAGVDEALSIEEEFVAACARADDPEARRILTMHPDIFERLSEAQLRQLPNLTESGNHEAVRLMVELGWPIAAQGGDWQATALKPGRLSGKRHADPLSAGTRRQPGKSARDTTAMCAELCGGHSSTGILRKETGPAVRVHSSNMACHFPIPASAILRTSRPISPQRARETRRI